MITNKTRYIPTTILDDFMYDPSKLKEWAESLEYTIGTRYPGSRTKCLSEVNYSMYNRLVLNILNIFSSDEVSSYSASAFFQKIPSDYDVGWVHVDRNLFTSVLTLSDFTDDGYGTSLYELIDPYLDDQEYKIFLDLEKDRLLKSNEDSSMYCKMGISNNALYKRILRVPGKYNRLVCFDGSIPHAADLYDTIDDRLTLIIFIHKVTFEEDRLPMLRNTKL